MTREATAQLYNRDGIAHSWWGATPSAGVVDLEPGRYRCENAVAAPVAPDGRRGPAMASFEVKRAGRYWIERNSGHAFLLREG